MTASSASDAPRLRLLLVEDETIIAIDLEDMLERIGHSIVGVAANVGQALRMIDVHRGAFDAALLDANLGGNSALPIAQALRAESVPFLLMSGYEVAELQRLGFREDSLRKPFQSDALAMALQALTPART